MSRSPLGRFAPAAIPVCVAFGTLGGAELGLPLWLSAVCGALGGGGLQLFVLWRAHRALGELEDAAARAEVRLAIAETSRSERALLFETGMESAPMALVLFADSGRIGYVNAAARELFFEGADPSGRNFLTLLVDAPPPLREALLAEDDGLFSAQGEGELESWHVAKREFLLEGEPHTLLMVKHLTRELARQEAQTWKKVIRVMSHELNNSVAPIRSLLHSARLIVEQPQQLSKLPRVLDTIEDRAKHLQSFLEGYARLARLPAPRPERVEWSRFLAQLQALFPHVRFGTAPAAPGWFDPAQVEQVLINVLRNAAEAGGPLDAVELEVRDQDGGTLFCVQDRGRGLGEEAQRNALLPFYSTKETGSGLGLALSRDIVEAHKGALRIENREGGGARVTLWLPGEGKSSRARPGLSSTMRLTLTRTSEPRTAGARTAGARTAGARTADARTADARTAGAQMADSGTADTCPDR